MYGRSSLLTAEQQARLDAAAAEAALSRSVDSETSYLSGSSPGKPPAGKPHRGKKATGASASWCLHSQHPNMSSLPLPPSAHGPGQAWGSIFDSIKPTVYALDAQDPNYEESESKAYVLRAACSPCVDVVAQYKARATALLEEYFCGGDCAGAVEELEEMSLDQPSFSHYFVKRGVALALDKGCREKELLAQLLSAAVPRCVSHQQLAKGFTKLLEGAQGLTLDVPDAPAQLALFLARSVADDCLPPSFLKAAGEALPEGAVAARAALSGARATLAQPAAGAQLAGAWGDRAATSSLASAKAAVQRVLAEYFTSRGCEEAGRALADLHVPFFAHEAVMRALLAAAETQARQAPALALLKHLQLSGAVSTQQMALGFHRAAEAMEDLQLDVPDVKARWAQLAEAARAAGLLRRGDPLVDSAAAALTAPADDVAAALQAVKACCSDIIHEYLACGSREEAAARLAELLGSRVCADAAADAAAAAPGALFVKRLVTHAADRGPRARENAALLLCHLVPALLPRGQVEAGFSLLLESADDLCLDVPDAPELLLLFILRAVVDDVLSPAWLRAAKASLAGSAGAEITRAAVAALGARHLAERALRAWVGPHGATAAGAKASMALLLDEFLLTQDAGECERGLKELELPFYTHELVKRACVLALERGPAAAAALLTLLTRLASSGAASTQQLTLGFQRAAEAVEDLALDVPDARERWAEWVGQIKAFGLMRGLSDRQMLCV